MDENKILTNKSEPLGDFDLEFNFELLNDAAWSHNYLGGFNTHFHQLVEHLAMIINYMNNKESFYREQIDSLNK